MGTRHAGTSGTARRRPRAASVRPQVSVVVPVHGKWPYTQRCLASLDRTEGVDFEVIVVDDASPDDTLRHLRAHPGVRVVALTENQGYVGACNAGIAAARGTYVVLLNNDTRVAPGWLAPLVETGSDPTVGLVGSQLLFPDGRLQEAGGIVFADGSGWNYGRFDRPDAPPYRYRRDVDYCSGASILVRRDLLTEIGGLDARFAPAYYDDADLAFEVRARGLRVVYEPRSRVVHDEGVSHGTDTSGGVKAYQVRNREVFRAKWATELAGHPEPSAAAVERAARRRQGRGLVVVLDWLIPMPDRDAGSVRMAGLLAGLRRLGYGVLLVPMERTLAGAYAPGLESAGIEVADDPARLNRLLAELAPDVVAVIASHLLVAGRYFPMCRRLMPDVPFVFDTVDLAFLREERELALGVDGSERAAVAATRELELALVDTADVTLVVSQAEQSLLRELSPQADVRVVSIVQARRPAPVGRSGRSGLLFVGSFSHPPNRDAMAWFTAEVLPLLRRRYPELAVDVVGQSPPPGLVAAAPAGVTYHGWVTDLDPWYARTAAAIAPLRYGAGVKGKVGDALSRGVPLVATSVAAEGMDLVDGETALIADQPQDFCDRVALLLEDEATWQRLSAAGPAHVDQRFGEAVLDRALIDLLADCGERRVPRPLGRLTSVSDRPIG